MMFENSKILFSPPPYDKSTNSFKKGVCGSLVVLLVIMSLFLCVGCKKKSPPPTTLANPVLTWSSPYFRWEEVPGADKYEVVLNDEVIYTYNNYIEITSRGSYSIKVKSISDSTQYNNSGFSNLIDTQIERIDSVHCCPKLFDNYLRISFTVNYGYSSLFEQAEMMIVTINNFVDVVYENDLIEIFDEQSLEYNYYIDYYFSSDYFINGYNVVQVKSACNSNYFLPCDHTPFPFTISK